MAVGGEGRVTANAADKYSCQDKVATVMLTVQWRRIRRVQPCQTWRGYPRLRRRNDGSVRQKEIEDAKGLSTRVGGCKNKL
jgi:hypothetical protein